MQIVFILVTLLPSCFCMMMQRGQGERLLIFKSADYPDMRALKAVMASVSHGVSVGSGHCYCWPSWPHIYWAF